MGRTDARWHLAVDELAKMPKLAQRLIDVHRPNERGRCLGCTTPGVGTADKRWPCGLYRLARAAVPNTDTVS